MFENAIYQDLIDKINKIRSYGINRMLTIPQIAILGDQSSGKSSVLEAITKLSFPRNIETCTRFATQVNLRRSEQIEMSAHIEGETEFNECHRTLDAASDIHLIISEAKDILCSNVQISEKVLEITISGPTLSPLTIIDLPGKDVVLTNSMQREVLFFEERDRHSHSTTFHSRLHQYYD